MVWVNLSLGSNIDPQHNIAACLDALLLRFRDLSLSSVFESEAVGFEGDNFLNMVVGFETDLSIEELSAILKAIEDKQGRDRSASRFGHRTLDVDILTFGNTNGKIAGITLPRPEIIKHAFVLWPLSQIDGKQVHYPTRKSYKQLWQEFDDSSQKLWPVNFTWHGRQISEA